MYDHKSCVPMFSLLYSPSLERFLQIQLASYLRYKICCVLNLTSVADIFETIGHNLKFR